MGWFIHVQNGRIAYFAKESSKSVVWTSNAGYLQINHSRQEDCNGGLIIHLNYQITVISKDTTPGRQPTSIVLVTDLYSSMSKVLQDPTRGTQETERP